MSAAQQACKIEDQYTKDQLYFYALAMNNLKENDATATASKRKTI